jgi:cyclophilin family peptidyl-prolyl cis-trans isomerase/HEAT repeat protein
MKRFFQVLLIIALHFSCEQSPEGLNKFSDPVIRKIYDLKDRRLSDSLYQYFNHESSDYRNEAVLAFASIQDSAALDQLGRLMTREQDTVVRKSLAFAIGQLRNTHSERIMLGALMRESHPSVLKEMLEAYGKATSHWQPIQPSFIEDIEKAEGLAWSIYRAGLNNATDSVANRIASRLLQDKHKYNTRLLAAHYFARSGKDFDSYFKVISQTAHRDPSPEVRMACVSALGKITTSESLKVIETSLQNEVDPRIKVNAIRALQKFPFDDTKKILYASLYNKNVNVGIAASEAIKAVSASSDWIEVSNLTERVQNWRIKANLYEAALKAAEHEAVVNEVKEVIQQTANPYQKAAMITALQSTVSTFDLVAEELIKADTPVVRLACASTLSAMNQSKHFSKQLKLKFAEISKKAMASGDPAVIGTLAATLGDSALQYRGVISDFQFLNDAREKLTLPKDNEAIQPLEIAIAYFERRRPVPVKNEFNNPLDWELIQMIKPQQEAIIKTSRGHIRVRLKVEDAPGSVANFLKLARADYFDKKLFHRVVPNFVIQAGCNRGDGWGSEDYSIRSEFAPVHYTTGSMGMASAGKDTEGTQWFITHSPMPHLDGRYSLFAEVIDGMTVVNLIEASDQIIDVEILEK